jgi:hypothetical protein
MKFAFFGIILFILFSFKREQGTNVYVCVSPEAPAYHFNKNCHGLSRCNHQIIIVSKDEAISKYKRRLCGFED